jgi:hypothetical protein
MGGSVSDKYVAGLGAAGGGSVYSIGAIAPGIVGLDFNQCFIDINGVGLGSVAAAAPSYCPGGPLN